MCAGGLSAAFPLSPHRWSAPAVLRPLLPWWRRLSLAAASWWEAVSPWASFRLSQACAPGPGGWEWGFLSVLGLLPVAAML